MDYEIIIYIVISILWLIIQGARKKKQKKANERRTSADIPEVNEAPKRSMIDEILEEIREERDSEVPPPPKEYKTPSFQPSSNKTIDYNEVLKDLENKRFESDEERFEGYEVEDDDPYDIEEEGENEYAKMLFEEEDGPRKAVILSEILNRKHF